MKYKDTAAEVFRFAHDCIKDAKENRKHLRTIPDPFMPYVWLLIDDKAKQGYIVYLDREDFETVEPFADCIAEMDRNPSAVYHAEEK